MRSNTLVLPTEYLVRSSSTEICVCKLIKAYLVFSCAVWRSRSMEYKGDGIDPARPTIWLYMLCRRGTPFEFLRSSFNFLYYQKNSLVLLIFLHPKKMYLIAFFSLIFPLFNVYNNLFWIHVYVVFVHRTNISYSNEVPSAKHVHSVPYHVILSPILNAK